MAIFSPGDVPVPRVAEQRGVRAGARPVALPQTQDPTGAAIGRAAGYAQSAASAVNSANAQFQNDIGSVARAFQALASAKQEQEDRVFVDSYQLEFNKRAAQVTAEALNSPDAAKPEFVSLLDQKLSEVQADTLDTLRKQGIYAQSRNAVALANHAAMSIRAGTARTAAVSAHNQRAAVLYEKTTQNVAAISRDAAQTGDLEGGLNRANSAINSVRNVIAPDKFIKLKNASRTHVVTNTVNGYIERGEYDKAYSILDRNRVHVGAEKTVADAAKKYGVDPAYLVATAKIESSGNPLAAPPIDPSTGKPVTRARGLFQFIKETGKSYGLPDDASTASVEAQADAGARLTRDNQNVLTKELGRKPNNGELYLAHFLGAGDAAKVLKADPSAPIASLVGDKAIRANKGVLGGDTTAGDVVDWARAKMVTAGAGSGISFEPYDLPPKEAALIEYHRNNLRKGTYLDDDKGLTTVYITGVTGPDGRIYNVPGFFDGQRQSEEAVKAYAERTGWANFPSYATGAEADAAAKKLHGVIERDGEAFRQRDSSSFLPEKTRISLLNTATKQQQQSFDRALKLAKERQKLIGDNYLREAYSRSDKGALTPDFVEQARPYVSPAEYKGLIGLMGSAAAEDNAEAVADLAAKTYTEEPEEFLKTATSYLRSGKLKTGTFTSFIGRNRTAAKDDAPASPYKSGRDLVRDTLNPGQLLSGPGAAIARTALSNATVEYDNWAQANPTASRADAVTAAQGIIQRYQIINYNSIKLAIGTSRYFGGKSRNVVTIDDVTAAERALYSDIKAKRLTEAQQQQELKLLGDWRTILSNNQALSNMPRSALTPPPQVKQPATFDERFAAPEAFGGTQ